MAQSQELSDFSGILTVNTTSNNVTVNGQVQIANQFIVGGGAAASEGGQIVLGYGNNLATAPTGQANNTWNIDVIGGNTGSTPLFRVFQQNGDGTIGTGFNIANTGRMHVGSLSEQTDSTFKVTGTMNVTSNTLQLGTPTIAANGYAFMPNGLKINWGSVAANTSAGTITYTSAFTTIYGLQLTSANTLGNTHYMINTNTTIAVVRTGSAVNPGGLLYYYAYGV